HYFDRETGLHYNRFRYYSPELGRYLQSDPAGISGGLNLYAYSASPLSVVDVRGMTCTGETKDTQPKPEGHTVTEGNEEQGPGGKPKPPTGEGEPPPGGEGGKGGGNIQRVGGGSVDNLRLKPKERELDPPGISVLKTDTPGDAADQMRKAFPNATGLHEAAKTIGSTTEDKIRDAGFDIMPD